MTERFEVTENVVGHTIVAFVGDRGGGIFLLLDDGSAISTSRYPVFYPSGVVRPIIERRENDAHTASTAQRTIGEQAKYALAVLSDITTTQTEATDGPSV